MSVLDAAEPIEQEIRPHEEAGAAENVGGRAKLLSRNRADLGGAVSEGRHAVGRFDLERIGRAAFRPGHIAEERTFDLQAGDKRRCRVRPRNPEQAVAAP